MMARGSWTLLGLLSILLLSCYPAHAQQASQKRPLTLFGQTLAPDDLIYRHYYDEIPYSFLNVTSDDESEQASKDSLLVRLFFNTEVRIKKLVFTPVNDMDIPDPIKQIHLFDKRHICDKSHTGGKSILYLDKEVRVLTIHVLPDPDVKDLRIKVKAYGLSRQSIFFIIRHLLNTRNDPRQNERLLETLYTKGYSSILSLLKYEEYEHLYLDPHSLFYLPDDADYFVPLEKAISLLKKDEYISNEGKKHIPKRIKKRDYLLFVDKEKIRFLKNVDPQRSIVIKKIDLAE